MSDAYYRVKELQRLAIPQRLLKGAAVLGCLWRENVRCASGWRRTCGCPVPTEFCRAKLKWLELLMDSDQAAMFGESAWSGDEDFFVIEAMTASQFEATGLTMLVQVPDAKDPLRVGAKGMGLMDFVGLAQAKDAVPAATLIQKVFK